jgi:hypothetical protein
MHKKMFKKIHNRVINNQNGKKKKILTPCLRWRKIEIKRKQKRNKATPILIEEDHSKFEVR